MVVTLPWHPGSFAEKNETDWEVRELKGIQYPSKVKDFILRRVRQEREAGTKVVDVNGSYLHHKQ